MNGKANVVKTTLPEKLNDVPKKLTFNGNANDITQLTLAKTLTELFAEIFNPAYYYLCSTATSTEYSHGLLTAVWERLHVVDGGAGDGCGPPATADVVAVRVQLVAVAAHGGRVRVGGGAEAGLALVARSAHVVALLPRVHRLLAGGRGVGGLLGRVHGRPWEVEQI